MLSEVLNLNHSGYKEVLKNIYAEIDKYEEKLAIEIPVRAPSLSPSLKFSSSKQFRGRNYSKIEHNFKTHFGSNYSLDFIMTTID